MESPRNEEKADFVFVILSFFLWFCLYLCPSVSPCQCAIICSVFVAFSCQINFLIYWDNRILPAYAVMALRIEK